MLYGISDRLEAGGSGWQKTRRIGGEASALAIENDELLFGRRKGIKLGRLRTNLKRIQLPLQIFER